MPARATWNALAAIALWSALATLSVRLREIPPFLLVGVALLLGSVFGIYRIVWREVRPLHLAAGIYGFFAYHLCLFLALRYAPPVEANLINYLWPLLIVVLAPVVVPRTRLHARHVAGALLGFIGAALLMTGGLLAPGGGIAGHGLALLAAIIWSTFSLLSRRFGGFRSANISVFCLAAGALSLVCHALLEPHYVFRTSDVPLLLLLGLGPMGAAFYLWDRALGEGDPRIIGTLAYLTPLLSTLLLTAFGGGRLGLVSLLAMLLIIGGAVLGTWQPGIPGRSGEEA
jgi:drug/metabolite transporter (DMT)-like permease